MATPMSADQMVRALRDEGVSAREYRSWRTHNRNHRGPWGGVNGIVVHHTAGRESLEFVYNGYSELPGPLCHAHLAKNGTLTLVGNGRANHAGTFARNAHDAVVNESPTHPRPDSSEPIDGNAHYYGIEIENLGNGSDVYPREQYDAAVRWATALCRHHGWSEHSIIGHKEGTRRKIDPHGPVEGGGNFDMDRFRRDVGARLRGTAHTSPDPTTEEPMPRFVNLGTETLTIPAHTSSAVQWANEWADGPGNHTDGGRVVLHGPAQYHGSVYVRVGAGASVCVSTDETSLKSGDQVRELAAAHDVDAGREAVIPVDGRLAEGRGLRVRVTNPGDTDVTVSATLRLHVW